MAVSVSIPKEITEYEEKIMFGMSFRKIICFSIAIALGIGTYFICTFWLKISMDISSYLIIMQAMPLMAIGFVKKDGMNFEKYFFLFLRHKLGNNKLHYEPQLIINSIVNVNERNETYDKLSKKNFCKRKFSFTTEKNNEILEETESFILKNNKKSRKRKYKETLAEIKRAQQEYRSAEFREKKKTV